MPIFSAPKCCLACCRTSTNFCQENERGLYTETLCDHGQGSSEPDIGIGIYRVLWAMGLKRVCGRAVASRQVLDGPTALPPRPPHGHEGDRKLKRSTRGIGEEDPEPWGPYTPLPPVTEALASLCSGMPGMGKATFLVFTRPLRLRERKRLVQGHRGRKLAGTSSCGPFPRHSQAWFSGSAPPTVRCQTYSSLSPSSLDPCH